PGELGGEVGAARDQAVAFTTQGGELGGELFVPFGSEPPVVLERTVRGGGLGGHVAQADDLGARLLLLGALDGQCLAQASALLGLRLAGPLGARGLDAKPFALGLEQ